MQSRQEKGELIEGNDVDAPMIAYRLEILELFLKNTVPILKLDGFRETLEYGRFRLTESSHMRRYLPAILDRHLRDVVAALVDVGQVSIIFDGTSHYGEVLVVLIRYWIQAKKRFAQRLIKVRLSDFPLNGSQLGVALLEALQRVSVPALRVVGFIHDAASVNFAAVTQLGSMNTRNALNLCCWSHIFNRVGSRLNLPLARSFVKTSANLFRKSIKVLIATLLFTLFLLTIFAGTCPVESI